MMVAGRKKGSGERRSKRVKGKEQKKREGMLKEERAGKKKGKERKKEVMSFER